MDEMEIEYKGVTLSVFYTDNGVHDYGVPNSPVWIEATVDAVCAGDVDITELLSANQIDEIEYIIGEKIS